MPTECSDQRHHDVVIPQPTCSICLQPYYNRTFTRPCYHSFCFPCIRHWMNMAVATVVCCPVCRQPFHSIVYNIDEEDNTFDEYHLKDRGNSNMHNPPLYKRRYATPEERLRIERRNVYQGLIQPVRYPEPLPRHQAFSIITPEYIPRARVFLQNELKIIIGVEAYDEFIENHFIKILSIPYELGRKTTYDADILKQLAEWLDDDVAMAKRLVDELIAYLKSGLAYKQFISDAEYSSVE